MAIFFHGGSLPLLLSITFLLSLSSFPSSSSSLLPHQRHLLQANSPQNIETFFPSFSIPALPSQTPPSSSSPAPLNAPTPTPAPPPATTSSSHAVAKAVAVTAAGTLVCAGVLFFFLRRCGLARRRNRKMEKTAQVISSPRRDEEMAVSYDAFKLVNGTLKGLVVDENGLDVLYWRQLEAGGDGRRVFRKEALDRAPRREKRSAGGGRAEGLDRPREKRDGRGRALSHANSDPITRIPSNSSSATSSSKISLSALPFPDRLRSPPHLVAAAVGAEASSIRKAESPLPPPPHVLVKEVSDTPPAAPTPEKKNPAPPPPPPPPLPEKKNPAPPPPPPPPPVKKNVAAPPPPPPLPVRKNPAPPPLPPRPSSLRPSSSSKGRPGSSSSSGVGSKKVADAAASSSSSKEKEVVPQTKLKPLHWDKLTANAEHSMVWDKIGNGSFQ